MHLQRVDPLDDAALVHALELAEHRESVHAEVRLALSTRVKYEYDSDTRSGERRTSTTRLTSCDAYGGGSARRCLRKKLVCSSRWSVEVLEVAILREIGEWSTEKSLCVT